MFHHAESPEVIRATRAEYERAVTRHMAECHTERVLTGCRHDQTDTVARPWFTRLKETLRPARRMRQLPGS